MNDVKSNRYTDDDFLPEKTASDVIWFGIYEGMICQKRAKPTEGYEKYESINPRSAGKISYIREFDHMKGVITGLERKNKKTQDGKPYVVFHVTFRSESGKTAIMETPVKSEWIARFAKCVENMDLKQPVYFRAFLDSKNMTAIFFGQGEKDNEEKIEQKYTQENPNGLPQWKKDPVTDEWDSSEYWAFLFTIIKNVAVPQFERNADLYQERDLAEGTKALAAAAGAEEPITEPEEVTTTAAVNPDDDIPF